MPSVFIFDNILVRTYSLWFVQYWYVYSHTDMGFQIHFAISVTGMLCYYPAISDGEMENTGMINTIQDV